VLVWCNLGMTGCQVGLKLVCFGNSKSTWHGHATLVSLIIALLQTIYTTPTETYQGHRKLTMQCLVLLGYVNEHREIPWLVGCDKFSAFSV
jgi:hypothetical protein